jgi:hypothetical protein
MFLVGLALTTTLILFDRCVDAFLNMKLESGSLKSQRPQYTM